MKTKQHLFAFALIFIFGSSIIFPSQSIATSWAYPFVVWDDYVYVVSEEKVTSVDKEIGHVTKYSDMESLPGNFSNHYGKGTKYYSIKGISTDEAIAVEELHGRYIKAYRESEYEVGNGSGGSSTGVVTMLKILSLIIIGVLGVVFFLEGKKRLAKRK